MFIIGLIVTTNIVCVILGHWLYTEHGVPKLCDAGDAEGYKYMRICLLIYSTSFTVYDDSTLDFNAAPLHVGIDSNID